MLEEVIKEIIERYGGELVEDRPKYLHFKTDHGEVLYSKMDNSIELDGDEVSISKLTNILSQPID